MRPQISFKISCVKKKYNLVTLTQLNTVNYTDTVVKTWTWTQIIWQISPSAWIKYVTDIVRYLALVRKGISNKDGIINKSHLYYYQIQQQALICCREKLVRFCSMREQQGIVSATGTSYHCIVEGEIRTPLELFLRYILPELAYPRLKFGLWYDFKLRWVIVLIAQVFYSLWSYVRIRYHNLSHHNL